MEEAKAGFKSKSSGAEPKTTPDVQKGKQKDKPFLQNGRPGTATQNKNGKGVTKKGK